MVSAKTRLDTDAMNIINKEGKVTEKR